MGAAKQAFMEDVDNYGGVVADAFVKFQSKYHQKKFKTKLLDAKLKNLNVYEKELRENYIEEICKKLSPDANLSFSWPYLIKDFFEETQNDSIY
jgi:hypothetical protein